MVAKFRRGAAAIFFEFFRQFPGDAHLCLGSDFNKDVEGFQQAMRRLKVDACFTTRDGAFQLRAAPAALHGQKSSKKEGISWKSGANERGKNGTGPGQDIYGESALPTSTDETESRIRYSWHAGICHKRDGFAAGDFLDQRRRAGGFIVLMQAEHRLLDVMLEQEHGRMTRVLGRDEIGFTQSLQRSQCDILQIPNRCRDNGEQDFYQPSATAVVSSMAASFAATGIAWRSVV